MAVRDYFNDEKRLNEDYSVFLRRSLLSEQVDSKELVTGYLEKANHDMSFVTKIETDIELNDWVVIGLFYGVYAACSALLAKRHYVSQDFNSTMVFIVKNYPSILEEDLVLVENLYIYKNKFEYVPLSGQDRSFEVDGEAIIFDVEKVSELKLKVVNLIHKITTQIGM